LRFQSLEVRRPDYRPAVLLRFVVQRLRERADFGVWQSLRRSIGIFARRIVVQDQQRQPGTIARLGVFQHLPVAGRIAERNDRAAADHHVNALGLTRIVVVQQQLWLLGENRLAALVIAVFCRSRAAHDLLGRDAIDPVRVDADKVLAAAGDDVGFIAVFAQVPHHFEHWLIG
jgi:hypothetical protein